MKQRPKIDIAALRDATVPQPSPVEEARPRPAPTLEARAATRRGSRVGAIQVFVAPEDQKLLKMYAVAVDATIADLVASALEPLLEKARRVRVSVDD